MFIIDFLLFIVIVIVAIGITIAGFGSVIG